MLCCPKVLTPNPTRGRVRCFAWYQGVRGGAGIEILGIGGKKNATTLLGGGTSAKAKLTTTAATVDRADRVTTGSTGFAGSNVTWPNSGVMVIELRPSRPSALTTEIQPIDRVYGQFPLRTHPMFQGYFRDPLLFLSIIDNRGGLREVRLSQTELLSPHLAAYSESALARCFGDGSARC